MSKKPHNKNISKVDSHFQLKLFELRVKIERYQEQCDASKRVIAKVNERLKTETDKGKREILFNARQDAVTNIGELKAKKKELIAQYNEVKKIYKMVQRAIAERWKDGFNEGYAVAKQNVIELLVEELNKPE